MASATGAFAPPADDFDAQKRRAERTLRFCDDQAAQVRRELNLDVDACPAPMRPLLAQLEAVEAMVDQKRRGLDRCQSLEALQRLALDDLVKAHKALLAMAQPFRPGSGSLRLPEPAGPRPATVPLPPRTTGPIATPRTTTSQIVPPQPRTTTRPITAVPARATTGTIPVISGRPGPRVRGADPARVAALIADRKAALDANVDHFAMLGLDQDAPVEAVRAAYFELARHLHPDRLAAAGVDDEKREAHRVFARINEAFGVLSDPDRRAEYARVLKAGGAAVVQAQAEAAATKVKQVLGGEEAFRQGEAALRRMALEEAVGHFQTAVERSPEEADYHAMLGWARYVAAPVKADVLSAARGHLRKAMELRPNASLPHLLLGRIARMEGEATPAINHLRQALELAPRSSEAAAELRAAESLKQQSSSRPGLFSRPKK